MKRIDVPPVSATAAAIIKYVLKGIEASDPQPRLLLCAYQTRQTKLSILNKLEMIWTISVALRATDLSGNMGRALSSFTLQDISTPERFSAPPANHVSCSDKRCYFSLRALPPFGWMRDDIKRRTLSRWLKVAPVIVSAGLGGNLDMFWTRYTSSK